MEILIEFENKPLWFKDPVDMISCTDLNWLSASFEKMEKAVSAGYFLAGFLSYEAGFAFEQKLGKYLPGDFPLLLMGIFDGPSTRIPAAEKNLFNKNKFRLKGTNITKEGYFNDIHRIKKYIESGDVYQITYCMKFRFEYAGDDFLLYKYLLKEQPVPYPAYIRTDDFSVLSLSPEMFIKKKGGHIRTKPMKGTWHRGSNIFSDRFEKRNLFNDPKNRAENVMIADLLRNDLGRVASAVWVPRLFEVAGYKTLFQMTSTVDAKIRADLSLWDLFSSLHPSGSVTGAPKIRAMEIITELEKEKRNVYTGAIGYITPQRDMFFNVPIRTLLMRNGEGEMGVGGGIVWDSESKSEYEESILKASFLTGLCQ